MFLKVKPCVSRPVMHSRAVRVASKHRPTCIGTADQNQWLGCIILLETVASVPRMVECMKSFNLWEISKERRPLVMFMEVMQLGLLYKMAVILAQVCMFKMYLVTTLVNPALCKKFVRFVERVSIATYKEVLSNVDAGKSTQAPQTALDYWKLDKSATLRDMVMAMRMDHRQSHYTIPANPWDM